jgi:hypothetical protein
VGPLRLMYIPAKLMVAADPAATAANVAAHEWLFRMGMASDMLVALLLVMLVMAFYRLFENVDKHLAALLVIFGGIIPATMYLVNVAFDAGALMLVRGESIGGAFAQPQRDALAMLLLRIHDHLVTSSLLLAGAWLFPMALLFWRSRFVPRFLPGWLFLCGGAWTAIAFTGFLCPQYRSREFSMFQPFFLAEIALTLWLLVRGSRPPQVAAP